MAHFASNCGRAEGELTVHLRSIDITAAPQPDRVRLVGELAYDDGTTAPDSIWFEFPQEYSNFATHSSDPWLACLLPYAVYRGENLRLCRPVDATLLENALELMHVWHRWYPRRSPVRIEAELIAERPTACSAPRKTSALFSGGVDSFFTVLRHDVGSVVSSSPVSDLLYVWGFDIPLSNAASFRGLHTRLRSASERLGKHLVVIATNLRECLEDSGSPPDKRRIRFRKRDWGCFYQGCALAAVGLLFESVYSRVLIASDLTYDEFLSWGCHPLTVPLLSTSETRISPDGAGFSRTEKTAFIAGSPAVQHSLHVCWANRDEHNCGRCPKCYQTMLTLEAAGKLSAFDVFDSKRLNLGELKRLFVNESYDYMYFEQIVEFASQSGREDIAKAIRDCLVTSRGKARFRPLVNWLSAQRVLWRVGKAIRQTWYAERF